MGWLQRYPNWFENKECNIKSLLSGKFASIIIMEQNILKFGKESFIAYKRQNINNYYQVLAKVLGRGAFGTVYKGRAKGTQGPWKAIKKLKKKQIKDAESLANQISILSTLDNPAIAKLYEVYEFNEAVYIVSELCEGGELFARLEKKGSLSEQDARTVFQQMVQAINYLHLSKIAHRDLKPQNFLFLTDNIYNLKLIDFGLAVKWQQSLNAELKQKGDKKIVGTSYYVAPEVLNFDYDERCDIWSLGVILYILLSATPPFDGQNDREILQAVKTMKYSLEIPELKEVSKEAKDLIAKMLLPADQRISLKEIFDHPWMKTKVSTTNLNTSFKKLHEYSKFSKLKKITANYVASQMSNSEVQKLGQLFRKIDVNHDGFITLDQLNVALADEREAHQLKELKALIDEIDVDKNGRINYTEFLASSLDKDLLFQPENLRKMFKLLDKDGNGVIDRNELNNLFSQNAIDNINGKSLEEIFFLCDKDKSGAIDFEEFKAAYLT